MKSESDGVVPATGTPADAEIVRDLAIVNGPIPSDSAKPDHTWYDHVMERCPHPRCVYFTARERMPRHVESLLAEVERLRAALLATGIGALVQTTMRDGHDWVRGIDSSIWWCQWCGKHRLEVADWTGNPQCPATVLVRAALSSADTAPKAAPTGEDRRP